MQLKKYIYFKVKTYLDEMGESISLHNLVWIGPTLKVIFKERLEGSRGNSHQAICE